MLEKARSLNDYLNTLPDPMTPEEHGMIAYSNMIDDVSIALMDYRMQHGLNQSQLAKLLNCSQSLVSAYENGERNISVKKLCELMAGVGKRVSIKLEDYGTGMNSAQEQLAFMTDPSLPAYDSFAA